jgi:osmotically-inducible protein OsmY
LRQRFVGDEVLTKAGPEVAVGQIKRRESTGPAHAGPWALRVERHKAKAAHMTIGVHVSNHFTLAALIDDHPRAEGSRRRALSDADIVARIGTCLSRQAQIDSTAVEVTAKNRAVTMHGHVRCWSEWQIAERVAWSMPSVTEVHNHLVISYAEAQS